mmetsp:Transcript_17997/g.36271  ORF Transcript_17997/g.36271 Transcript_17997/m.36271 type:complete len:204 (-) Transcript_17997:37-648(-)
MVCLRQLSSSRSEKSSRACAPRDSLRASAEYMVMRALSRMFWSSRVSMRSVFHTRLRSFTLTSLKSWKTSSTPRTPDSSDSCVRKTAASRCIVFWSLVRTSAVDCSPCAYRYLSRLAMDASPALAGSGACGAPGVQVPATCRAAARPNTTMSRRELAPRRLAPCTDAHPASPAAYSPFTMQFSSPFFLVTTWPNWLVGMPPML